MSNVLRPQQVVLSGMRFHCASFCFTARQPFERTCGPPISRLVIARFISLGLPGGESEQVQTSHCRSLDRQNSTGAHCVCNGGQQPFSTHDVKSSDSVWIHVCVTVVPFHSVHVLQNYRPQWCRHFVWIMHYHHFCL